MGLRLGFHGFPPLLFPNALNGFYEFLTSIQNLFLPLPLLIEPEFLLTLQIPLHMIHLLLVVGQELLFLPQKLKLELRLDLVSDS